MSEQLPLPLEVRTSDRSIPVKIDNAIRIPIHELQPGLVGEIKNATSFWNPKWWYQKKYKEKSDDQIIAMGIDRKINTYFIEDGCLCISRGMKKKILALFGDTPVEVEDATVTRDTILAEGIHTDTVLDSNGNPIEFHFHGENRDYQLEMAEPFVKEKQGVIFGPAGSGKTALMALIISMINQPTLIMTHTKVLLEQTIAAMEEFLKIECGRLGGGRKKKIRPVTVATVQTLRNMDLSELTRKFGAIFVDECHHVPSTTFTEVTSQFPAMFRGGFSASKKRKDRMEFLLHALVGEALVDLGHDPLYQQGYIVKPDVKWVKTGLELHDICNLGCWLHPNRHHPTQKYPDPCQNPEEVRKNCDIYDNMMLKWIHDEIMSDQVRNTLIVNKVITRHKDLTIVVCERTRHVDTLSKMINDMGITAVAIHGKIPTARLLENLRAIREQSVDVGVTTSRMLAEGFDCPPLDCAHVAAPNNNWVLTEQMVGRVQRSSPGKDGCRIYDYVDEGELTRKWATTRFKVYKSLGVTSQTLDEI